MLLFFFTPLASFLILYTIFYRFLSLPSLLNHTDSPGILLFLIRNGSIQNEKKNRKKSFIPSVSHQILTSIVIFHYFYTNTVVFLVFTLPVHSVSQVRYFFHHEKWFFIIFATWMKTTPNHHRMKSVKTKTKNPTTKQGDWPMTLHTCLTYYFWSGIVFCSSGLKKLGRKKMFQVFFFCSWQYGGFIIIWNFLLLFFFFCFDFETHLPTSTYKLLSFFFLSISFLHSLIYNHSFSWCKKQKFPESSSSINKSDSFIVSFSLCVCLFI